MLFFVLACALLKQSVYFLVCAAAASSSASSGGQGADNSGGKGAGDSGGKKGSKRDLSEREAISLTEDNEVLGILKMLPASIQKRCAELPVSQRANWLNIYLNGLIKDLPLLHQNIVCAQPTNQKKFTKLKEFLEAKQNKKSKK